MRERMRTELSRSQAGEFDLKQDAGGIGRVAGVERQLDMRVADPGAGPQGHVQRQGFHAVKAEAEAGGSGLNPAAE